MEEAAVSSMNLQKINVGNPNMKSMQPTGWAGPLGEVEVEAMWVGKMQTEIN